MIIEIVEVAEPVPWEPIAFAAVLALLLGSLATAFERVRQMRA